MRSKLLNASSMMRIIADNNWTGIFYIWMLLKIMCVADSNLPDFAHHNCLAKMYRYKSKESIHKNFFNIIESFPFFW